MNRVTLLEGDISGQEVDAVINAANASLVLGSGVAGAIRERGGPTIQAECDAKGPIEVGRAVVTAGGDLPASHVIHAAVMELGGVASEENVRESLSHALDLARELECGTLACPALGTGVGGLSMQRCAEISFEQVEASFERGAAFEEVRFVLFSEPAYRVFEMVRDAARVSEQMERIRQRTRK